MSWAALATCSARYAHITAEGTLLNAVAQVLTADCTVPA